MLLQNIPKAVRFVYDLSRRRLTILNDSIPYAFHDIADKKLINWLRVETSAPLRPFLPLGFPTHLQIEPTNYCNLGCELCPVSSQMHRPRGLMDLSVYRDLLNETGGYLFLIFFWDWGEPFMHPSAFDMIAYAHEKTIRIISSTNGHLFSDQNVADEAIRCGLDTLIFAVDGISQKTYEKYRHKGDLQKALDGIRMLNERKKVLRSTTPLINFRFIAMKHNEQEIERLPSLVHELGANVLTLKTLNPLADNTYGDKPGGIKNYDLVPQNPCYSRFTFDENGKPVRRKRNACRNLYNSSTIHWNGTVCPCTYDYDDRFVLGDLHNSSFEKIWKGSAYRTFRDQFRRNDPENYFCYECSYAFKGGSCIDETVLPAVFFDYH